MTTRQTSNAKPSVRDSIISAVISILIIGIPFVLFIIPLSTKDTTRALESFNIPDEQWEMIDKDIDRDSFFTPEGNAKTEYTLGSNVEIATSSQFNSLAEDITGDHISNMQVTNNYYYSCVDDANTCVIAYTKDFEDEIGKKSVVITRTKGVDKETAYPEQNNYTTIVKITVSEQPYQT